MAILSPIDGFDWDIADEPTTYSQRDRDDACRRALAWCQAQALHQRDDRLQWEGVPPIPVGDGWLHVGDVIQWDDTRLAIQWEPTTDAVRVERSQSRVVSVDLPPVPPWPREPVRPPLPERPDTTITIPIVKLHELLRPAVQYRRARITDPLINSLDLNLMIFYGITPNPFRLDPDGWVKIGIVTDHFENADLGVWWNPETDRVRIERPRGRV